MEHFFTVNIYLNLKIILRGSRYYEPHFTGEETATERHGKVSPRPCSQTAGLRVPALLISALCCLLGHDPQESRVFKATGKSSDPGPGSEMDCEHMRFAGRKPRENRLAFGRADSGMGIR